MEKIREQKKCDNKRQFDDLLQLDEPKRIIQDCEG